MKIANLSPPLPFLLSFFLASSRVTVVSAFFGRLRLPKLSSSSSRLGSVARGGAGEVDVGRRLQDQDPCAIPFEDATRTGPAVSGTALLRSDYVEKCFESLTIDADKMAEHILSLDAYFEQHYCFYDIAREPNASEPQGHQPELGYEIWQEGTVDLKAELTQLSQIVQGNGASMATFWDIQDIFNQLRDGHVALPGIPPPFPEYGRATVLLIPESVLQIGVKVKPSISYAESGQEGSDPELTLTISLNGTSGVQGEKTVQTMNGESVLSFFLKIANAGAQDLQSEGARLNSALLGLNTDYGLSTDYGDYLAAYDLKTNRPSSLFPEKFKVMYTDGSSESYYSLVVIDGASAELVYEYFTANKTLVETNINQPGKAYHSFLEMVGKVPNLTNSTVSRRRQLQPERSSNRRLQTDGSTQGDQSYSWYFLDTPKSAAFQITDEYAVLKIQDFDLEEDYVVTLWANFTKAAKAKGVKKAMIDISKNPGGIITAGDTLTVSMFPTISYDWFVDQFDRTYNDAMMVWNNTVMPILRGINDYMDKVTNQDLHSVLEGITEEQERIFITSAESVLEFCEGSGIAGSDSSFDSCQNLGKLRDDLKTLIEFRSGPQLRTIWDDLVEMLVANNPFATGSDGMIEGSVSYTVNRGGVEQNLTGRNTFFKKAQYDAAVASALQIGHSFDEYILVSDGIAYSTADTFATSAMQLWANRDKSGVMTPVKGITYGGTPDPKATTLASAPANVLNNIAPQANIVAYAGLFLLSSFLADDNSTVKADMASAVDEFGAAIPVPPYFAYSLPSMPIRNYYSKFMAPGALPLQYVTLPATNHIPQIYRFNTIGASQDLQTLYTETAKFFTSPSFGERESIEQEGSGDGSGDGSGGNNSGTTDVGANDASSGADASPLAATTGGATIFALAALVMM